MVNTRYNSHRTEFKKLYDKVCASKSGDGYVPPTDVQKWKLKNWAFLAPFIKKKKAQFRQELGKVSIALGNIASLLCYSSLLHIENFFLMPCFSHSSASRHPREEIWHQQVMHK